MSERDVRYAGPAGEDLDGSTIDWTFTGSASIAVLATPRGADSYGIKILGDGVTVAVASSSVANPSVVTTSAAHGITNGATVTIAGHTGSTPAINGSHVATVIDATTFSIPVNVTAGGTGGTVTRGTNLPRARTGYMAVQPGDLCTLVGYLRRVAGTDEKGEMRLLSYNAAFGSETQRILIARSGATGTWLGQTKQWVVPTGVAFVRLEWRINLSPPGATEEFWWDDVRLEVAAPGALRVLATGTIAVTGPAAFATALGSVIVETGVLYVPTVLGVVTADVPPDFSVAHGLPWIYGARHGPSGTATAATDLVNVTGHGLVNGQRVRFYSLTGGAGLALATPYYVISATQDTFQVSTTFGGAAVNITTNYSAVTVFQEGPVLPVALAQLSAVDNFDETTTVEAQVTAFYTSQTGLTFTFRYYLLAEEAFAA